MKKNLFIALEGLDGSGKSTQVRLLSDNMKKAGLKVYVTYEPTDSPIGSIIRNIMKGRIEADHRTIAGLFVADRLDHLLNKTNGILKKLDEGFSVISDRYYFSSYAYQGAHVPMEWVMEANSLSAQILKPDLNVYIDISPEVSIMRLNSDRNHMELYETTENLQKVRKKYMEAFELLRLRETIFITEGSRSPEVIATDIWNEVSRIAAGSKAG
jgi:dTMP kinase